MLCKDCEYLMCISLGCYRCSLELCPDPENDYCYMYRKLKNENSDNVKHPAHYADTVPGIECIQVTRWMNFCRGSAVKYLWRAGIKDKSKEIEDLRKAIEFIEFEIDRLEKLENYTK